MIVKGSDGRIRDPSIPATWNPGRSSSRPPPDPHQEVPEQCRNCNVVPNVHVGNNIPQKYRSSHLVRHGCQVVRDPKGLEQARILECLSCFRVLVVNQKWKCIPSRSYTTCAKPDNIVLQFINLTFIRRFFEKCYC